LQALTVRMDPMGSVQRNAQRAEAMLAGFRRATEQREGRKYSTDTAGKLKAIHEALTTAASHTGDMMREAAQYAARTSDQPNAGHPPDAGRNGNGPGAAPDKPAQPVTGPGQVDTGSGKAGVQVEPPAQTVVAAGTVPAHPPGPSGQASQTPPG